MPAYRIKTLLITFTLCVSAILCNCQGGPETQDFSFVIASDIHVPSYSFPVGDPLDEGSLMQMHNQQRLQDFVEECLAMEPRPAFIMNNGDTGDAGWLPLLKLHRKIMQPLVSAEIPVYTVVGNHDLDYAGIGRQDLAEMFDPLGPEMIGCHGSRYSFDFGGCHFIVMNNRPVSGLIRFNPKDIDWLRDDLLTVAKDTRILLFLHANMQDEDTHHIAELLQPFHYPVIFQGHKHSEGLEHWGGIPVVLTSALYGGDPKAGSYRMVHVRPEGITVQTRDFAKPVETLEPEETISFPQPGPVLSVIEPENNAFVNGEITVQAKADPSVLGTLEYRIPGITDWTPVAGKAGTWEERITPPTIPGRHLMTFRFTGENGAVVLAHRDIKVPGKKVREVWTKDLGSAVQGAPVIYQDNAILPTIENGLFALRLGDGAEIWHCPAESGQIIGRIALAGTVVCYGAGRTVHACDAQTGKLLWQTPLDGTIIAGVTGGNGRLFVPAGEHKLYCLDAKSGDILWEYSLDRPIIMEPAADVNMVFFGAMDGYFRALDAATGRETWKHQWSSMEDSYTTAPFWPPVPANGKVIACKNPADRDEMNLVAFNASDGALSWSQRVNAGTMRLALSPDKDKLYTSFSENGRSGLQCFAAKDGSKLWSHATGVAMNAGIVTDDVVLHRDAYHLCCVDAATGVKRWQYHTDSGPQGSYYGPGAFALKGNLAVIGTMGGYVTAVTW